MLVALPGTLRYRSVAYGVVALAGAETGAPGGGTGLFGFAGGGFGFKMTNPVMGKLSDDMAKDFIRIGGAREHNLKNLTLEIPRDKLFDQIQSGTYVSDPELWRAWQDQHDSAQVSFVAFVPTPDSAAAK